MKKQNKMGLFNTLIYGNIKKKTYHDNKKEMYEDNKKRLHVFCIATFILSFILFTLSLFLEMLFDFMYVYFLMMIFSIIMHFLSKYLLKINSSLVMILSYIFITIIFVSFKIAGINYNSSGMASTLCGIYVLIPLFLADIPFRYSLYIIALTIWTCLDTIAIKSSYYAYFDCINCSAFCLISIILSYYLFCNRMEEVTMTKIISKQRDTDFLTNLNNRISTENSISDYLSMTEELSVMFLIDLDNFKYVNDTYGHVAGDKVLVDVADVLRKVFRKDDLISRIGGDEFVIFVKGVPNIEWAKQKAKRIVHYIKKDIIVDNKNIIGYSVGVAFSNENINNYQDLFANADKAMYDAKNYGKNCYVIFDSDK